MKDMVRPTEVQNGISDLSKLTFAGERSRPALGLFTVTRTSVNVP